MTEQQKQDKHDLVFLLVVGNLCEKFGILDEQGLKNLERCVRRFKELTEKKETP